MLRIGEMWRKTNEHKEDRMHNSPCIPGDDRYVVDPKETWTVAKENILYKCGWSPFEGYTFHHAVWKTFVNGQLAYDNGRVNDEVRGMEDRYS